MTEKERELIEIVRSYPDTEYALNKAIEIISQLAEPLSTSQVPNSACPREST